MAVTWTRGVPQVRDTWKQLGPQGSELMQNSQDCHLTLPGLQAALRSVHAGQLRVPLAYLRKLERRGRRWSQLQLVSSSAGRCHEPIAMPSATDAPPTAAHGTSAPSSGRPPVQPRSEPRPFGKPLSSSAPAPTVTQIVCSSVCLSLKAGRFLTSQGASKAR